MCDVEKGSEGTRGEEGVAHAEERVDDAGVTPDEVIHQRALAGAGLTADGDDAAIPVAVPFRAGHRLPGPQLAQMAKLVAERRDRSGHGDFCNLVHETLLSDRLIERPA